MLWTGHPIIKGAKKRAEHAGMVALCWLCHSYTLCDNCAKGAPRGLIKRLFRCKCLINPGSSVAGKCLFLHASGWSQYEAGVTGKQEEHLL